MRCVWRARGLQADRLETFKLSRNSLFADQVRSIGGCT